jgi:type IV secretory pathway TraG/TraD family ATPase VirD4
MPSFPDFDQFITVCRSMGVRLTMALQNIEQLKKNYEKTERTIRGNAGTWLFLKTSDLQSAKELSEIMGKYTTRVENHSHPIVSWLSSSATNIGSSSESDALTARSLVEADELMRWPPGQVMTWQAGYAPANLPLPDLSAWAKIWPDLQKRHPFTPTEPPEDEPNAIDAVKMWRPSNPPEREEPARPIFPGQTQPPQRPAFPGAQSSAGASEEEEEEEGE